MGCRQKWLVILGVSLAVAACGPSSDGDDGDKADASQSAVDAGGGAPDAQRAADAAPAAGNALGQTCTPSGTSIQGTCPANFMCIQLQGGVPFCSQPCTMAGMADPMCSTGYTGPGAPVCIISVDTNGDMNPDINGCGVICDDLGSGTCPTCNGTCPGNMGCTAPVRNSSMQTVATMCI